MILCWFYQLNLGQAPSGNSNRQNWLPVLVDVDNKLFTR